MIRTIAGLILVLSATLSTVPMVSAQSLYVWTLSCQRTGGLVGNIYADWNWTANGVSIQGNFIGCASTTGSGTVPSNANGIIAHLVTAFERGAGCFNEASTTKSFALGTVPTISLESSCKTSAYGQIDTASATFNLGPNGTRFKK